jgi:hypothetical protein
MTHSAPPVTLYETGDILTRYNTHVTKHLSAALTEVDVFPSEILNELRGAFTHLAKAHSLGAGTGGYYEENGCAMRHLKRASLDCLKISILAAAERLQKQIDDLTTHVLAPPRLHHAAEALRERRRDLMNSESSHPSLTIIADLEVLYVDYKNLLTELHDDYQAGYMNTIAAKARKKAAISIGIGFILGIVASLIASWIFPALQNLTNP